MSDRLKKLFQTGLVCSLILMSYSAWANAPKDPETHFFMEFFGDLTEELANAREQKKKAIMLFFEQEECPFCARMKANILNRPDVQKYFRDNFLVFKIDIEGDIEIVDFAGETLKEKDFSFKKHRVRATPVIGFFDLEGNMIEKYIGATSSVEEFMWLGEFVIDGHYKTTRFSKYRRAKKQAKAGN